MTPGTNLKVWPPTTSLPAPGWRPAAASSRTAAPSGPSAAITTFTATDTTGAVAKKLRRQWIGIERDPTYIAVAQARIDSIIPTVENEAVYWPSNKPREKRIPFIALLEANLLYPGEELRLDGSSISAVVAADGALIHNGQPGSIHKIATQIMGAPCNGWMHWYYFDTAVATWQPIDALRQQLRKA